MQQHLSWLVGGAQGSGVDTSATLFARTCSASGLWVFGQREYHSNIKGEHSYYQVRVADVPLAAPIGPIDILATFDRRTLLLEFDEWLGLDLATASLPELEQESDPRIDALVARREEARASKDWAEADRIRDALAAEGVVIHDTPEGPRWRRQ